MVKSEKCLGIVISNNLKVGDQLSQAVAKANRMLGVVNRTVITCNKYKFCNLYESLVRPHLEYGISAWNPHCAKDKVSIEGVQQRFSQDSLQILELWHTRKD
jgi:hypothetical protein